MTAAMLCKTVAQHAYDSMSASKLAVGHRAPHQTLCWTLWVSPQPVPLPKSRVPALRQLLRGSWLSPLPLGLSPAALPVGLLETALGLELDEAEALLEGRSGQLLLCRLWLPKSLVQSLTQLQTKGQSWQ